MRAIKAKFLKEDTYSSLLLKTSFNIGQCVNPIIHTNPQTALSFHRLDQETPEKVGLKLNTT